MAPTDATAGSGRIRVIVEMAVGVGAESHEIFALLREWAGPARFAVDLAYTPVPIRPRTEYRDRLVKSGERVVIAAGWIAREDVSRLEQQHGVLRVSVDTPLEPFDSVPAFGVDCATYGDPIGNVRRLVKKLDVDAIWAAGFRGEGIVVGVVDGGITARGRDIDFGEQAAIPKKPATGRVIGGWPNDWGTTALGWSEHGNMMAFDVQAIAPAAALWDIRIWQPGATFPAFASNAVAGFRAAITHHKTHGTPHILTNSWGLYDSTVDPLYAFDPESAVALIVEEALDEGILVLFAAGNCGSSCPAGRCGAADIGHGRSILGPNGHPRVMTVGAADLRDDWCGYTSQGPAVLPPNAPKPDFCSYTRFDGYFPSADWTVRDFDGGTSAATAVAAGVVALLKQKRIGLTQLEARSVLKATAADIRAPGFDPDSGAGIIRAKAAFDEL